MTRHVRFEESDMSLEFRFGKGGIGITGVSLSEQDGLDFTLADGTHILLGESLRGADGKDGIDGKDGVDGKDGANGADGKDGANGADGKDGVDGADGRDGLTPHVGENGNWWLGDEDTGVRARAEGTGTGAGAVSSSLTGLAWDADSAANASYHFKAFRYPIGGGSLNVDFDVRVLVGGVGFRYPCNLQRPFGDASRIIFRTPRIIFEDEASKAQVTYLRAYERAVKGSDTERELWLEIKTAGAAVTAAHLNVQPSGGEVTDVALVRKDYDPYVATSGLDSLTVWSADWANKTSNFNISSRATAPYATAGGNDSRAEGEASDAGGIRNTIRGEASFGRGWENDERGDCNAVTGCTNTVNSRGAAVSGEGNTNTGNHSVQGGNACHNEGYSSVQVGHTLKNYGGNAAQFGHTNENRSQHVLQTGYANTIPTGCDYASTVGTRLTASRRLQSLHGQYNAEDSRALAIWANGSSSAGKNVFAIPESGTPTKDYDGITLGFLDTDAFREKLRAALPIYQGEVESV